MLRIHDRRFLRAQPKEVGIEHFHARQVGGASYIIAIVDPVGRFSGRRQFLDRNVVDKLDTIAQVRPELVDVACARDTQRHADNGNVVGRNLIQVRCHLTTIQL